MVLYMYKYTYRKLCFVAKCHFRIIAAKKFTVSNKDHIFQMEEGGAWLHESQVSFNLHRHERCGNIRGQGKRRKTLHGRKKESLVTREHTILRMEIVANY